MQSHQELAESIAQYLPETTAAHLHGALVGMASAKWPPGDGWAMRLSEILDVDPDLFDSLRADIDEALGAVADALADSELGFDIGVDDNEEVPLEARVDMLARWTDGFLLGYASVDSGAEETDSEEAAELLEDLTRIRETLEEGVSSEEFGGDDDEDDLEHIVEFLRVAAISLFLENAEPLEEDGEAPILH